MFQFYCRFFWVIILGMGSFISARAIAGATETLPAGINSPSIKTGYVTGVDERFGSDGDLYKMGDFKSVQFTSENLSKFNARAQQLIEALNRFGTQDLGKHIDYGVLRVETKPTVSYFAPVYARGITEKWTLGVGIPIVTYKNKISLRQENSNLEYYRSQLGGLSPELDTALHTDLVKETQATLAEKGYRPIEDRNETFLADVQLASLYRLYGDRWNGWLYSATLNLPTGPKYDSDDLAAMNIFGRTALENKILWSNMLNSWLEVVPFLSHTYNFEDQVTVRVPQNEDDVLPDQSSKEKVSRKVGDSFSTGGDMIFTVDENYSFGTGYTYIEKQKDQYSGTQGGRYDLVGSSTHSKAHRLSAHFNFSTVKTFLSKKSKIPAIFSYAYSDTVAGVNVERRTINEMTLMMFF